ncbi:MAG: hypothetical protein B7Z66_07855 [Chromatiales bacterium 21-64-14]|nr:MAG: hypothetical protein B7Z66_07855 [Chromatiales bacterium 21-64-14]
MGAAADPTHLRRTLIIAFLVGSWLVFYNLGDQILHHGMNTAIWIKIGLNYLTPFVVANLGLLSRKH